MRIARNSKDFPISRAQWTDVYSMFFSFFYATVVLLWVNPISTLMQTLGYSPYRLSDSRLEVLRREQGKPAQEIEIAVSHVSSIKVVSDSIHCPYID